MIEAQGRLPADPVAATRLDLPKFASIAAAIAILYFAKDVLLPLSIGMLITFALSPLATRLRKFGLPNLLSVLLVVATAFAAIGLFILVVVAQVGTLAQNLPTFQANIITKVEGLRASGNDNGIIAQLTGMITAISDEIGAAVPASGAVPADGQTGPAPAEAATIQNPMPVEVVESQSALEVLQNLVLPLVSPIATVGLVIVVVIFMLLEREDLRDRFIRLVGSNDLLRTTQVLQDAGQRVGQYLLVQLLVNMIYALPIGIGLWLIGVPNATLWGLLTLVLRFVPYVGSLLAAAFPLFLAFAVSPDWSAVIWTLALFTTVELITSNMIEPWLYGSRTGVSPLAIIVSAILWTWLWGPMGLVLSTPLTVCLVVLGRHIPQFEVFDIMFGDDPVLAPHARLYQRLLVGDGLEATFRAEEALETVYLRDYYRDVGIPALLIAQNDHARGMLTTDQRLSLAEAALTMVSDLAGEVLVEMAEDRADPEAATSPDDDTPAPAVTSLPGHGFRLLCVGGRSDLDDVAAAMLAQTLAAEGATAALRRHHDLARSRFASLLTDEQDGIILTFLDAAPSRASLLHVRRLKRAAPHLRVGCLICEMPVTGDTAQDRLTLHIPPVTAATLQQARDIGADFVVTTLDAATRAAFLNDPPVPVAPQQRPAQRSRSAGGRVPAVA